MSETNAAGSPLESAAEVAGDRATEAFSLLGNETRLAILLALWEAYEPFPEGTWDPTEGNAVPFSELRERVGVRDSGQFNYHLDKLEGHFLEQTADGYQLLPAGQKLVRTVIAGAGLEAPRLEPVEIDVPCQHCGAATAITYQNQRVYQVCTVCDGSFDLREKHPSSVLSAWMADPNILKNRSAEEIYSAVTTEIYHQFAQRVGRVCPECSGHISARLHVCERHNPSEAESCPACQRQPMAVVRYVCAACKHTSATSLTALSYSHPAVGAFAWKHGIELSYGVRDLETARWLLDVDSEQELLETDPPRVKVALEYESDAIHLTFDETLTVIAVNEQY